MGLKSFAFHEELEPEIYDFLFGELFRESSVSNPAFSYVSDIVDDALTGKIDLNRPSFNIGGYVNKLKATEKKIESNYEANYVMHSDDEKNTVISQGIKSTNDDYEKLLDDDELISSWNDLQVLNGEFMISDGIDIIQALRGALNKVPSAVGVLKIVCEENKDIANLVEVVLSSGYTEELLAV